MEKVKIKTRLEVKNEADSERAELYLYGTIRQSYWWDEDSDCISAKIVKKNLDALNGKNLDIHINSNGGDVFESIAICNMIKQYKGEVDIYIDAMAASGASIIATAGKNVYMYNNSMQMIHKAWTYTAGNADDMRKLASDLDKIDSSLKESYMSKFVGTDEELEKLVADETYLTAKECLAFGLCSEIIEINDKPKEDPPENFKETLFNKYNKEIQNKVSNKGTLFNSLNKIV